MIYATAHMPAQTPTTASRSNAFGRDVALLRAEIDASRHEATTGRLADPVAKLGARNAHRLSLDGASARLETVLATNGMVSSFLSVAQMATGQVAELSDNLAQMLTAATGGGMSRAFVAGEAQATLESLHDVLTMRHGGRAVFGGDETDTAPLAPLDTAKAQFRTVFEGHFGFLPDDPASAAIGSGALEIFLDTVAEPALSGPLWDSALSRAGAPSTARIGAYETVALGPTVDEPALREAFLAALVTTELTAAPLSARAFETALAHGLSSAASASADTAQVQGMTAISEGRVEQASERLRAHSDVLTRSSDAMVATDTFAAAARFNDLTVKLEAAYTMTGRMQQLTLLRFLP